MALAVPCLRCARIERQRPLGLSGNGKMVMVSSYDGLRTIEGLLSYLPWLREALTKLIGRYLRMEGVALKTLPNPLPFILELSQ